MKARIRRRKRDSGPGRPSLFFIVALALGMLLLVWIVAQVVTKPVTPPKHSTDISLRATSAPA